MPGRVLGRARIVQRGERHRKGVPPVDGEARAADLHPRLDLAEGGELGGEDLRQEHGDEGHPPRREHTLHVSEHGGRPLPAERAEDDAPAARPRGGGDGGAPQLVHPRVLVHLGAGAGAGWVGARGQRGQGRRVLAHLECELLRVRVVAVERDARVGDHHRLGVEAAVCHEGDRVHVVQLRGGAAERLAGGERLALRDRHRGEVRLEGGADRVQRAGELDRAAEREPRGGPERR